MTIPKIITRSLPAIALASCVFGVGTAHAQDRSCDAIERLGNGLNPLVLRTLNDQAAGKQHRISKRKRLRINAVESVEFNGCSVKVKADVTLKRKVRRNGHGHVIVKGKVSQEGGQLCLSNPKVKRVKLSRTTRVGEGVYKWVANKMLPKKTCFDL